MSHVDPSSAKGVAHRQADAFLEAFVAAYALMAHSDGEVAAAERRRLISIVRETPAFEPFSYREVEDLATSHEARFKADPETARAEAWDKLAPIAGHRRAAQVLVSACRELMAADGIVHPDEHRALAAIKSHLGVDGPRR